jgi:hypothetical protein
MKYTDIKLGQYVEIYSILTNVELEQDERIIYLCMLFDKDILNKPIGEFKTLSSEIMDLLKSEPKKTKVKDKYKLNGTTYRLHKDFGTLTTSQFIDFQNYLKDGFELQEYNKILSVFLIPEGEIYNNGNYDIKQLQADIDNYLSIVDALTIADFFLRISKVFVVYFQRYLHHTMKKMKKEKKKNQNNKI